MTFSFLYFWTDCPCRPLIYKSDANNRNLTMTRPKSTVEAVTLIRPYLYEALSGKLPDQARQFQLK